MKKTVITLDFNGRKIYGDIISNDSNIDFLFIHGAGTTNRTRYEYFRNFLASKNISSVMVDLIGHGETGGDIKDTTLRERTEEVLAILKDLNLMQPLKIIAFSMGAYNAIKLTELLEIDSMVLFVPAVYHKKAYNAKFGPEMSHIIRALNSWQETDAWSILNKYTGNILLFAAEKDQVVPFEVVKKIYDNSLNAKSREIIILPKSEHKVSLYFKERPDMIEFVTQKITELL